MNTNPAPGTNPATKRRIWPWAVGGAAVLLVIIGVASGPTTPTPATPTGVAASPAPSVVAPPAGPVTQFGDGTYAVGTDITPGTYHTTGESSNNPMGCYWSRSSDDSGDVGSIIANNIGKGPATVTISASDASFQTEGCNGWTLVK